MTPDEWARQWRRLDHFRLSGDAGRDEVSAEWFAQLKHWDVEAVDHGITRLIGAATDTFLPGLGVLRAYIQERIGRYDRPAGACATCHGSGWVEAAPFKSNGLIYANALARCPDCGIPAPQLESRSRRAPVSEVEWHEYQAGRYGRDQMPEGLRAKPPKHPDVIECVQADTADRPRWVPGKSDLAAFCDRLAEKLGYDRR